ncbi:MAG TPA: CHASE3 domain-containing protein [Steroidobacteraceae bacterium]|nr:CHASE3 domain-containing protein [Steroidobacteraceae bacterium]
MKWNVGTKIAAGFAATLAIFLMVSLVAWRNVETSTEDAAWVTHTHEVLTTVSRLLSSLQSIEGSERGFIITGDAEYLEPFRSGVTEVETQRLRLAELVNDNPAQSARVQTLASLITARVRVLEEGMEARQARDFSAAQEVVIAGHGKKAMDDIRAMIAAITATEEKLLGQRALTANQAAATAATTISACTVLGVILATIIGFLITRNVSSPLRALTIAADRITVGDLGANVDLGGREDELGALARSFERMMQSLRSMAAAAEQIAAGDLRASVTPLSPNDVVGHAFVKMSANLRAQIGGMVEGAAVLGSAASQIVASTSQLASGASESAAAVSQTTTTVEEIRQTAQVASQKARGVSDTAQRAMQVTTTGRKSAEDAAAGMVRIRAQMDAIGASMMRLSEQSQAIGQIIASVEDLAAQSNLLAVNAAIEAAKAGEQGKGFSVVAQEVKSLAEQSRQATDRVRTILSDIQKATTAAVMATEQGNKAVEAGSRHTELAGESIQSLSGSVSEAAQAATQIAASSQQQLVGMDQVAGAMESIKQASTQNVASARQLETAARNLSELGQRLKRLVDNYAM